ncbi:MAG: hypothetical protein HZC51_03980 [Nitrospirae bacterium]|nr:hypothetical protein [Nitrospirota bacterium]
MATVDQVGNLKKFIKGNVALPVSDLLSKPDWGSLNFREIQPDIEKLYTNMNIAIELPLDAIPVVEMTSILEFAGAYNRVTQELLDYTISQPNHLGIKDNILRQLSSIVDNLNTYFVKWLPYLAVVKSDFQLKFATMETNLKQSIQLLDAAKQDISTKSGEINELINDARTKVANAGVEVFANDFSHEATFLHERASRWLTATIILALVTIIAAFGFLWGRDYFPRIENSFDLIQFTTSKLIVLGLLFTATIWCSKIYKATKHQEAINKHRANALKTFEQFAKGTSDETTKNAVLLETTKSIFTHTNTGYIDGDQSQGDGGIRILEMIKNVTTSEKN